MTRSEHDRAGLTGHIPFNHFDTVLMDEATSRAAGSSESMVAEYNSSSRFVNMFPVVVDADGKLDRLIKVGAWEKLETMFQGDKAVLEGARHTLSPASKYEFLRPIVCPGGELDRTLCFQGEWDKLEAAYHAKNTASAGLKSAGKVSRLRQASPGPSAKKPRLSRASFDVPSSPASPSPLIPWTASSVDEAYDPAICHNQTSQEFPCHNKVDPRERFIHCYRCRSAYVRRSIHRRYA